MGNGLFAAGRPALEPGVEVLAPLWRGRVDLSQVQADWANSFLDGFRRLVRRALRQALGDGGGNPRIALVGTRTATTSRRCFSSSTAAIR